MDQHKRIIPEQPHPTDLPEQDHHRDVTGGALRAGVFGAMDGLVSNFALVAGVVGGGASQSAVVLTGLAGLSAGAFSMAVGEYTSVASQTEAMLAEIDVERKAIASNPQGEAAELAEVYRGYGVEAELADAVAQQITSNPEHAVRVHVKEELGVDPDDLPSPYVAAGASFLCFAVGAVIPILPFLLGLHSLLLSTVLSAVALFVFGAIVSRFTLRSPVFGGVRQLLLGVAAALATFGIGTLVGTGLS